MIGDKLNAAINLQMNKEFFASYSYLALAAHFESEEFSGFAKFFLIQSGEETQHAMRILNYLHRVGGRPILEAIQAPRVSFGKPVEAFEYSLESERKLAAEIDQLYALAIAEKHAATQIFLQWFITEQVEEEALFTRYVKRLKLVGDDADGLLLMDRELGERKPESGAGESGT